MRNFRFALVTALTAGTPLTAQVKSNKDIPYVKGGVPAQRLDVYAPPGADRCPVMVYVHGGGWRRGDKRAVGLKATSFTGRGFVFVSVNYRLLPAGRHPNNVEDIAAAVAWLHDHVKRYGGDPGAMFLMGHSAGSHLVALAGTDARRLKKFGKPLSVLKGVIANDTQAYDIAALMGPKPKAFYASIFGDDPKVWRDASPIAHAAKGRSIPPFLILHSTDRGRAGRAKQAAAFAAALRKAGVAAQVVAPEGRTHGQMNRLLGKSGEVTTEKVAAFLDRALGR